MTVIAPWPRLQPMRQITGAVSKSQLEWRYARWKALLLGALLAGVCLIMIVAAIASFDASWSAKVARGQSLLERPAWFQATVFLTVAFALLWPASWLILAAMTNAVIVTISDEGIAARTIIGTKRFIRWHEVASCHMRRGTLILSRSKWAASRYWDLFSRSVLVDGGLLECGKAQAQREIGARLNRLHASGALGRGEP